MAAPPYMKLYVADYLADTNHLTRDQHGAYFLLLMAMWRAGGKLPNTPEKLAAIAGCTPAEWKKIAPVVMGFFKGQGGSITHKRVRREMAHYEDVVKKRRAAQKIGEAKRLSGVKTMAGAKAAQTRRTGGHNQSQNQNQRDRLAASDEAGQPVLRAVPAARAEGAARPPAPTPENTTIVKPPKEERAAQVAAVRELFGLTRRQG